MARLAAAPVALALLCSLRLEAAVLRSHHSATRLDSYTYAQYARDFGRRTVSGSEEHARLVALFQAELVEVRATNARNTREGRLWKAGVHPFMDWTPAERQRLNGYKPSRAHGRRPSGAISLLHSSMRGLRAHAAMRLNTTRDFDADGTAGGLGVDAGPPLRDQGNCGSCWAISAVEAVEAQLQRSGSSARVSAQALIDCVPNPQHCGGSGGCDGATGELAYAFMRDYGIPLEQDLPYTARTQSCPENPLSGSYPASQRVRVSGWTALPSNQAAPLMEALVSQGPAVVAVDGNNWFNYESGIFDSCEKDADLGHAVLAKGYGQEAGTGYWLIQNSWGRQWGEQGHIRLQRHEDEDAYCGTDHAPKDGVGCDGGPPSVKVCGTCGVLYDALIPEGVHVEGGDKSPATSADPAHDMEALLK